MAGEIKAPYFEVANEKVVRRHVYATALAAFWREYPETFQDVNAFFFCEGKTGPVLLEQFLSQKPEKLKSSLQRIVPSELYNTLQIDDWGWISGLMDPDVGVLSVSNDRVTSDISRLDARRNELINARKPSDFILKVINTIKEEYLITFLSKQNVIPKYGFPVDVVDLQILHHSDEAKALELSRDLRIALSEYAPSGQVVAGGKLWTSRYIKKLPDRIWRKFTYAICDHCQCYQRVLAETGEKLETCIACSSTFGGHNRGDFIVPQFGTLPVFFSNTRNSLELRNAMVVGVVSPERTVRTPSWGVSMVGPEACAATSGVAVKLRSSMMLSAREPARNQNPLPFISIYSFSKRLPGVDPRNYMPVRELGGMRSMSGMKDWDVSQAGLPKGPPGMNTLYHSLYKNGTGLNGMYVIPNGLDLFKGRELRIMKRTS